MQKKVSDVYVELAHYTSPAGLKGILESQSLWASHARFLNDPKEIDYFFDARCSWLVEQALERGIKSGRISYQGKPAEKNIQAAIEDASMASAELTGAIRSTTRKLNQPHILSLCGTLDPTVARDGLLSQWRAYGGSGGYALIFDAKLLEARLNAEWAAFQYQHMQFANVHYFKNDGSVQPTEPEIEEAENNFQAGIEGYLRDPSAETLEGMYMAVTTLCCLYKHWGFHEEHEVRVVAIPVHPSLRGETKVAGDARSLKEVKYFLRDGCPIPYIDLLRAQAGQATDIPLPVTRVLVGPHRDAERRKEALEHMLQTLRLEWPVLISQTPYLGASQ